MKRFILLIGLLCLFTTPVFAANEVLEKAGPQISFADHAGDFAASAANNLEQGSPTDVQLITASVADAAARASAKFDFGPTRAGLYTLTAAVEMAATPTTGEVINFYLSASPDGTAANGNPGYCTGSDAAYSGGVATLAEGLNQLMFIGSLVCSADATTTVQIQMIGMFHPPTRYGILVIENQSGAAFHSDDVETHFVIDPVITEIQ